MKESLAASSSLIVLYEDEQCFVLNKPSGIHSVSLPEDTKETLAVRLLQALPSLTKAAEKSSDAGLVQRLDFETSGVLLGAKSRQVWTSLHGLLGSGKIEKSYIALVEGSFPREMPINNYLGNSNRRAKKVKVFSEKPRDKDRALPARSRFSLLNYFSDLDVSLVRVSAPTARRHQVRAHAASSGHPLVGDDLYGSQRTAASIAEKIQLAGTEAAPKFLLHAETIAFAQPETQKKIIVTAPLPQLAEALYRFGKISAGGAVSSTS